MNGCATARRAAAINLPVVLSASGDSSTTRSGITTGAIKPIFDANTVSADVNAQLQITQAFSQVAPKSVGDYAQGKLNEANVLRQQATKETDPAKKTELIQQASALDANWGEGGAARVALHTAVGALSGGLAGAVGAGTSALTVPLIADQIKKLDIPVEVKQALILTAGAAIGGATGGTAGVAAGLGETGNNYLLHESLAIPQKSEAQRYADATKACANRDANACQTKADLETLSLNRDKKVAQDCNNGVSGACQVGMALGVNNGSHLSWTENGKMVVTSPEYPVLAATPTTPNPFYDSYQGKQAANLSQSLPIAAVVASPEIVATLGARKIATGAILGAGFDAAGQYVQMQPGGTYRPGQTVVAGVIGAVAYPLSGSSSVADVFVGGAANATNTTVTNSMYGKNDSVVWASIYGAGFSGVGHVSGNWIRISAANRLTTKVGATYIDPTVSIFQQKVNLGAPNPYPALIGTSVSNAIGGIPSFVPLPTVNGGGD